MSANDSSRAWNLRCAVREQIVDFLQKEHPEALPRHRAEMDIASAGEAVRLERAENVAPRRGKSSAGR
jgi:hypothetical protein